MGDIQYGGMNPYPGYKPVVPNAPVDYGRAMQENPGFGSLFDSAMQQGQAQARQAALQQAEYEKQQRAIQLKRLYQSTYDPASVAGANAF